MFCTPFMSLLHGFVIFLEKEICPKAAFKVLLKLTKGVDFKSFLYASVLHSLLILTACVNSFGKEIYLYI